MELQKHQIKNRERLAQLREKVKNIPETTFAYLAGYYDGEGCLTVNGRVRTKGRIRRSRVPFVCIKISSMDKEPLDEFCKVFGGSVYEAKRKTSLGRTIYNYRASLNETRVIIECLLPYLKIKKQQSELALLMFEKTDNLKWKDFKEEKIKLIEQIRSFNHKGKKLIQVQK